MHPGEVIRRWRARRSLSLRALAQRAGISHSTLSRWEAGRTQPSVSELHATLEALHVQEEDRRLAWRLLDAPRGIARLRYFGGAQPPVSGDLLRTLRLRRGLTQSEVARTLGITQSMVARWENSEDWPSDERLHQYCHTVNAYPEELQALLGGQFKPVGGAPELHTEEDFLLLIERLRSQDEEVALKDLVFVTLEARLWSLSAAHSFADLLLTYVYNSHLRHLTDLERYREAEIIMERTLPRLLAARTLPRSPLTFGSGWEDGVIAVSTLLSRQKSHANLKDAIRLVQDSLPYTREPAYTAWMQGCMGIMLAKAGHREVANKWGLASRETAHKGDNGNEVPFREVDHAHALFVAGRPGDALLILPRQETTSPFYWNSVRIPSLVLEAECYAALDLKAAAHDVVQRTYDLPDSGFLPSFRSRVNKVNSRL